MDVPPVGMSNTLEQIRKEIVRCARDRSLRSFEFSSKEPVVWKPTEVINPECGIPFTDISAWHYIADCVEAGCVIQQVILRKPPGAIGYEIHLPGADGQPQIYVKVCLRQDKITGRSFHNSTR
jgi:hypothetical protein